MSLLRLLLPLAVKRGRLPVYLIHFVTSRCNAACGHCFVKKADPERELAPSEVETLCHSLGRDLYQVCITGGEPFLREDLVELVQPYLERTGARVMQLSTNGYLTDRVVEMVGRLARVDRSRTISVNVSIDGVGHRHDAIRKVDGLFERAVRTYRGLLALRAREPNVFVNVNVTVSRSNEDHLLDLYAYLRSGLEAASITTTLARGEARDPGEVGVDPGKYEEFAALLARELRSKRLAGYASLRGRLVNAQNVVARDWVLHALRGHAPRWPCYAGRLAGVLDSEGFVYACELRATALGNVRQDDFRSIWQGPLADGERAEIRSCSCTHECFLLVNILFNPSRLPAVAREMVRTCAARGAWSAPWGGAHG